MVKNIFEETDIEKEFYFYSLDRKIEELKKSISKDDLEIIKVALWKMNKECYWCYDQESTPSLFGFVSGYKDEN